MLTHTMQVIDEEYLSPTHSCPLIRGTYRSSGESELRAPLYLSTHQNERQSDPFRRRSPTGEACLTSSHLTYRFVTFFLLAMSLSADLLISTSIPNKLTTIARGFSTLDCLAGGCLINSTQLHRGGCSTPLTALTGSQAHRLAILTQPGRISSPAVGQYLHRLGSV